MKRTLKRFYIATTLVLIVAGALAASLLQPAFGTRTDFSIYNTRWNGASTIASELYGEGSLIPALSLSRSQEDVNVIHRSFSEVDPEPSRTSLVVLGPARSPTAEEAAWLRDFFAKGGRMLLADDFGRGNEFLTSIGAGSRFDGALILELSFAKKPEFAVATDFTPHEVTTGIDEVVLDHATELEPGPNATVLGWTGASSWLDLKRNVIRDGADPQGPFAWLAIEPIGRGEVLLVSDPSVFINGMRPLGQNRAFASLITEWLTEDGRGVLIDESFHDYADPVKFLGATLREVPTWLRYVLAISAAATYLAFALGDPGKHFTPARRFVERQLDRLLPPPPPSPRDPLAKVRERHPDWDENTLRNLLRAWSKSP